MATASIADKLSKLEKKIAKREKTIADEQEQLNKEMEEYNKLYLTALASKYKLSGKDLFSAIEREHEQLEKLREGEQSVDEIIAKFTLDEYAEQRNEIAEHKDDDCLYFLPAVAKLLRMTEGTLRRRPLDIQLAVCKRYVDNWYCDTYTIQHELRDAMMLITKPEP